MRLIDVDAIPENEMNYPVWVCLRKQPTIDAVPVIRCKDCKYWIRDRKNHQAGDCLMLVPEAWVYEHDFCSYGERKE